MITLASTDRERQRQRRALRASRRDKTLDELRRDESERGVKRPRLPANVEAGERLGRVKSLSVNEPGNATSATATCDVGLFAKSEVNDGRSNKKRTSLTIGKVLQTFGRAYRRQYRDVITLSQDRVLRDLTACWTPILGTHDWECDDCSALIEIPNSCGNRHCPTCGQAKRDAWAAGVKSIILPIEYHHVILTVPHPITQLAFANPKGLYAMMMQVAGQAILKCGLQLFGVQMGLISVLHTWGQLLNRHLHDHSMVAAGGLSLDGQRWIPLSREQFKKLLQRLQDVFRDLFLKRLRKAYERGELQFHGDPALHGLESPEAFERWLEPMTKIRWIVRCPGIWDPVNVKGDTTDFAATVVHYLARYVNRIAISNSRLVEIDGSDVLFRYKDYQDNDQWKTYRMDGVEFVCRFLSHVLPRGFCRTRRYGFMGTRVGQRNAVRIRKMMGWPDPDADEASEAPQEAEDPQPVIGEEPTKRCSGCGGKMFSAGHKSRPKVGELMRMPLKRFYEATVGVTITAGRKRRDRVTLAKKYNAETSPEQRSSPVSAFL